MSRTRWSQLETAYRSPTPEELRAIRNHFPLGNVFVAPDRVHRTLRDRGAQLVPAQKLYLPPRDREFLTRYRAARRVYPALVRSLESVIRRRSDQESVEFFLHNTAFDSGLEVLHALYLLAQGATPVMVTPALLDHLPQSPTDPATFHRVGHRPHLCLHLGDRFDFLQVSFRVPGFFRVDVLRYEDGWRILELDGPGHTSDSDPDKQAIGLPISRFTESELLGRVRVFLAQQQRAAA